MSGPTRSAAGVGMTSQRTRDRLAETLAGLGIYDPRLLEAIRTVPRHLFVEEALESRAYDNTPLPIGHGQTISQPWVVARMTELLLELGTPQRVLEVGTGSGYQAAILAQVVPEVYSVERIGALIPPVRARFRELGYHNVMIRHGDGYEGWPEYGPYQGVIVTAAPESVPEALLAQLDEGGRLVAPVGGAGAQELLVVDHRDQAFHHRTVSAVSFVPMLRGRT